jgi:hypothetical protein
MKKMILRITLFFSGLALALGADWLLKAHVGTGVRKGIVFWVFFTVSFTLYRYLLERFAEDPGVRPLHFPRVLIATTATAIVFGLISTML